MNSWNDIWEKKASILFFPGASDIQSSNEQLRINGFNHNTSAKISSDAFNDYLLRLSSKLELGSDSYVYEFGCGSGFFLKSLALQTKIYDYGGSDKSNNMTNLAIKLNPGHTFKCIGAESFKLDRNGACIIANSVFQYFDDLNYARSVLENVISNKPKSFAFLDIPFGERAGLKKSRSGPHSSTNLQHLIYDSNFFNDFFNTTTYVIEIEKQFIQGYTQSVDRFNVYGKLTLNK